MKTDTIWLTLAFLGIGFIVYTSGCSCMRSHPQEHYCSSDFVILARVLREKSNSTALTRWYKVRVRKEYKMTEKALVALKSGIIHTGYMDAMCGINLDVGKLYVISGKIHSLRAHANLCGMVERWESFTKRQRKGLKMMYRHGCTCKIHNCYYGRCYRTFDACNWTSDCQTKEGFCLRGKDSSCRWTNTPKLRKCLKNESPARIY